MRNITLIGMPGCGKSTAGIVLAKELSYDFIDTDIIIQNVEQRSLQSILDDLGYMELRQIEQREILKVDVSKTIISTGGSAVYSETAMNYLSKNSIIVFINVSLDVIKNRVKNFDTRGIAGPKEQTLETLFNERFKLYSKYAHIAIDSDLLTLDETVDLLKEKLQLII